MNDSPLVRYIEALRLRGGSAAEFAKLVGVDPSRMSRYLSGGAIPANDVASAIERETGGEVPVSYWASRSAKRRALKRGPAAPRRRSPPRKPTRTRSAA